MSDDVKKNDTQLTTAEDVVSDLVKTIDYDDADSTEDYDTARDTLQKVIAQGSIALESILSVAQGSDHPRAYEVVGIIMKQLADTSKDLLGIHKTKREIKNLDIANNPSKAAGGPTNNLFVGSTKELMDFLETQNPKKKVKKIDNDTKD